MNYRILIVEDEIIVATEIEDVVSDMGHIPVGIASDRKTALELAAEADVALVDLNLRDGPTGMIIGKTLAETHGVTVVFMTANPSQLGDGVPGTLGVLPKPATERDLRAVIDYATAKDTMAPPSRLRVFACENGSFVA